MMEFIAKLTLIEPRALWGFAGVALFALLAFWALARRRSALQRFSDTRLLNQLNPDLRLGQRGFMLQWLVLVLALSCLVLALARPGGNPQLTEEEVSEKGIDIQLLVDCSASMKATDIAPSRMQATKAALKQFIDLLSTDRVGLVIFAGVVSLQSPLTLDYRTAKMMLDIISTDFLPVDGTALGDALKFGLQKIGKETRPHAVMILLTDGENTRGTPPVEVLPEIKEAGTRVYTIGVGTAKGAKIEDGLDAKGRPKFKTYMGQPVVTKLDESLLQRIAQDTGGKYFAANTAQGLMSAYAEISRMTKTEHKEKKKKVKYQEYYMYPAALALALLLWQSFLGRRASWGFRRRKSEHA